MLFNREKSWEGNKNISVQNSMDRSGLTGKFRKNWSNFKSGALFPVRPVWILVEWIGPTHYDVIVYARYVSACVASFSVPRASIPAADQKDRSAGNENGVACASDFSG